MIFCRRVAALTLLSQRSPLGVICTYLSHLTLMSPTLSCVTSAGWLSGSCAQRRDQGVNGWWAFVAELSRTPGAVAKLAAVHLPDEAGLCRACGEPGRGTPHVAWPCSLYQMADHARSLLAEFLTGQETRPQR